MSNKYLNLAKKVLLKENKPLKVQEIWDLALKYELDKEVSPYRKNSKKFFSS